MHPSEGGWIEAICGCMYSGKSEELIRRLRRALIAHQEVLIIKPAIDDRYEESFIVSHSEQRLKSVALTDPNDILDLAKDAVVIGIDEAQFFGMPLLPVIEKLADDGKRVIIAGLDMDFKNDPFEPIPQILAKAEYITKTLAICVQCGRPASRTQRLTHSSERVLIGGQGVYEARCRKHHTIPQEQ
ncbi:thymidine kinase [bacterium]|nr:thymidine kinase [bacterium]